MNYSNSLFLLTCDCIPCPGDVCGAGIGMTLVVVPGPAPAPTPASLFLHPPATEHTTDCATHCVWPLAINISRSDNQFS